jgi:hypothetical protein
MNTYVRGNFGSGDDLACLTKEHPMVTFTEYRERAAVGRQNTNGAIAETSGPRMGQEITPLLLRDIISLPPARIVKVLEVREQFKRGKYEMDERLDAVLDRLLADINT